MRVVRTATVVLALVAALLPMLPLLQHPCCFSPEDHVLLVIAHPDDETMFFAPTLLWLQSSNVPVSVLCLSTGNAYGQGTSRVKELIEAAAMFGIPATQVKAVNHHALPDGMDTAWPPELVADEVALVAEKVGATKVLTFDARGVSGHANHQGVCQGVRLFLEHHNEQHRRQRMTGWSLETTNLARKYSGPLDLALAWVLQRQGYTEGLVVNRHPWRSLVAMSRHKSQLTWYRWLFMALSRYNYLNTLVRLQ